MTRLRVTFFSILAALALLGSLFCPSAGAQSSAVGLDAFLEQVRQRAKNEERINRDREREFRADLDAARTRIQQARTAVRAEQDRRERLLTTYDANEATLTELEAALREEQGGLGEMFGVVRQSAGDFHAQFLGSLAMADTWLQAREIRKAAETLIRKVDQNENCVTRLRIGRLFAQIEDWSAAVGQLEHATGTRCAEVRPEALLLLGMAAFHQGRVEEARKAFIQARDEPKVRRQAEIWLEGIRSGG